MTPQSNPVSPITSEAPPLPGLHTLPLRPASTHTSFDPREDDDVVSLPTILDIEPPPRRSTAWTLSSLTRTWSKDPANPANWRALRRWSIVVLLALVSLVVGLFSTGFEPAQDVLISGYHNSTPTLQVFCNTISYLGMALGALIISPLSELIGRSLVIHFSYILYMIFLALAGFINNMHAFLVFRFFMGVSGVVFQVLGPAIVADIIEQRHRGLALSLITCGFVGGKALGPILGEYVSALHDPRWISWSGLIALGILYGLAVSLLRETYPPLLRNRKEIGIGEGDEQSPFFSSSRPLDMRSFRAAWTRPFRFLIFSPIIALLALFTAIYLSVSHYIWIEYEIAIAQEYNLPLQRAVLFFIGPVLSIALSTVFFAYIPDHWVMWHSAKSAPMRTRLFLTPAKPEYRLPFLLIGAFLVPGGIIWYGLTLHYHTHWILPILGATVLGVGVMGCTVPVLMYIVDAYTELAASAVGAVVAVGSLAAGVVPLSSVALYDRFGPGMGSAILGAVSASLLPLAIIMIIWGKQLKGKHTCFDTVS